MPELPDVILYVEALRERLVGQRLEGVRLASPFLVRSVIPPLQAFSGRLVDRVDRMGKRIVFAFDGDLFLVLHLMIAGRLRWRNARADLPGKVGLAAFDFAPGTLLLTEAGSKRQASLYAVAGRSELAEHDRGGLEVFEATAAEFQEALTRENHTLKRSLTDPAIFSGIGNAYSDEILHAAGLSPMKLSHKLTGQEVTRLFDATVSTLRTWIDKLREQAAGQFPEKVTAFHGEMAVHGKYGQPCPRCGTPVQRIVYARNESNYCPTCQTEGKLLSDRSLSRLLREDWPRTLEELDRRRRS